MAIVRESVPEPALMIRDGMGGIQSGIGGGPAMGPLGMAGLTPTIQSPAGK